MVDTHVTSEDSGGSSAAGGATSADMESGSTPTLSDAELKRLAEDRKENLGEFIASAAKSTHKLDLKEGFHSEDNPWRSYRNEDIEEHRKGGFLSHQPMMSHHHHHGHHRHGKKKHKHTERSPSPTFAPCLSSVTEQSEKPSEAQLPPSDSTDAAAEPAAGQLRAEKSEESVASATSSNGAGVSFYVGGDLHEAPKTDPAEVEDVTFFVGAEDEKDEESNRKNKRHHHHTRPYSEKDLARRRHRGSEVKLKDATVDFSSDFTQIEDESELNELDKDNLASHRFDSAQGNMGKKVSSKSGMASVVYVGKKEKPKKSKKQDAVAKRKYDHSPHEMFVEMDELQFTGDSEWKWSERARWIKFEEDVEEGAERWGRPHVASLSFHCLLELRQCLQQGAVIMDLEAEDLTSIVNHVVDQMVITDQLEPENRGAVLQALLLKHSHVGDEKHTLRRNLTQLNLLRSPDRLPEASSVSRRGSLPRRLSDVSHKSSGSHNLDAKKTNGTDGKYTKFDDDHNPINGHKHSLGDAYDFGSVPRVEVLDGEDDKKRDHVQIPMDIFDEEKQDDRETIQRSYSHCSALDQEEHKTSASRDIQRCIPKDAEATTVLVGTVDFLSKPIMAFVRLSEGRYLGNLTEVNLPVRFIFILMGPKSSGLDYYEIGRSISTLMANRVFQDVAYKAESHQDMIDAINDFLDDSIVLPPGDYNKETLLPIMSMAHREAEARKKRRNKLQGLADSIDAHKDPDDKYGDPLKRTGRPFRGLINDIKRRYPKYLSDITDGLNLQCLATFFFVYFACLSPAITFGGLLSEKTEKWMGVSEMLVGVSISGLLFALFSGQPILILGATGPMLVFEEALYQICDTMELPFMPFRVWCGFWVTIIAVVLVALEGSFLVRYFTRFIQEIFALLISLIFVIETFIKLSKIFQTHPLLPYYPEPPDVNGTMLSDGVTHFLEFMSSVSPPLNDSDLFERDTNSSLSVTQEPDTGDTAAPYGNQPNTALLSLILCFGTFLIAYFLKQFRNSKFLGRSVRRALGDFGVPIAIVIMVAVDYLIQDTYTEKLDVPDGLSPTASYKRGWLINPIGDGDDKLAVWMYFAAAVPALLVFILIFMESEITSMIVNKKDRKLKKGSGYHLDLLLIGAFATMCGILGLPFVCAATVRSVTHVSALTTYTSNNAPGEKAQLQEVKEQRMTGIAVHIVIGVSVLMGPVLRQVPLAVLFGVFLYMGVASMSGIQLLDRFKMIFMPVKHHPYIPYVRQVKTYRMHIYTFVQLLAIGVLWAVKSTQAALAFPFILIILVPVRLGLLKYIFTEKELSVLDREEEGGEMEDEEEELDFYAQAHMPM